VLKGVRVSPSRVAPAAFATGAHIDVVLYASRASALALAHAPRVISLCEPGGARLAAWHTLLHLVSTFTPDREPMPELFALLRDAPRALSAGQHPAAILFGIKLRFVRIMGYGVHLVGCTACGTRAGCVFFSGRRGGVLCVSCGRQEKSAVRTSARVVTLMRHFDGLSYDGLARIRHVPPALLREGNLLVNAVLQYHTDVPSQWWVHESNLFPAGGTGSRDAGG